ncbi:hypothetical protein ASF32_08240 [Methylobacterium sp. Leaf91]|mgnify:CR=1 FL=1|jgi:hypothetical protein|nr:hypothetical protein ASF24_01540 [Methylobacterium sp. Leaf86]KQO86477.1 hypothetical protein ASF32_08240 [Methylobacterium sp. Leaf91]
MHITLRLLFAGLLISGATSVLAQTAGPSQTTGQNLESAGSFRNIAPTGVTKPPGAAAAPDTRLPPDEARKKGETEGSGIKGICIGCN